MDGIAYAIGNDEQKSASNRGFTSLSGFSFESGYRLSATDLGNQGVKIDLLDREYVAGAVILPPNKVAECGRWMLSTLGQDERGLPRELSDILERLSKDKGLSHLLKRGDKKKIKDALRILRS